MTAEGEVRVIRMSTANCVRFGPTTSDRRTVDSGLKHLGSGFLTFEEDGICDAWTLRYEEVLYVAAGSATLLVGPEDSAALVEVLAHEGDVVVVPEGSTVRYGGTKGTRLFWSLVPQDWETRDA